ncbi:HEAT repeat domain-containing protein [Roseiconus nitratireducens]|uniref:HEAT repeat domain-containing protein n=1 Tax=Roseiconus nitratireducens TaxID=2605748 RepID=A0A5M6D0Q3_9BACT|nr:HEAT repeat domain-containing protein [Roseiconus nitratireducens]KAA5541024.1 HEAT repeat domain-containing protein [Roseiconus nitratireducens]
MSIQQSLAPLLGKQADPVAAGYHLRELAAGDAPAAVAILAQLADDPATLQESDPAIIGALLRVVHDLLIKDRAEQTDSMLGSLEPDVIDQIDRSLPAEVSNRHLLLHLLSLQRTDKALRVLVQILNDRPPTDWMDAGLVLSPLMQHDDWSVDAVFPEVLKSLSEPALAASLLDLANYLVRSGRVQSHPAAGMLDGLNELLGEVSRRLAFFEENPRAFGDDVPTVQKRLGEAVALAVSLCDAVALIGDESSIAKLNQTVALRHRRVQCEAAGALAKLGDEEGRKRLVELSEDPAARLRAIAYADELGFGDEIDPQQRTDQATAEAEMALWLSQPHQMGVPPTSVEVVESRRMLWPSFDSPVDVTLVRFEYNLGDRCYSNIGMTGPATYTMSCDLADMPVEDIFAIYAGWHADHPDIFTVAADSFNEAQIRVMEGFQQHLQHLGYEDIRPAMLGLFLDERAGMFTASREGTECVVATDGLETIDHAIAGRNRPLGPADLFNLYKGRKMLRTFNS